MSSTEVIERPDTRPSDPDLEDGKVAHIIRKDDQMRGYVLGEEITALCGEMRTMPGLPSKPGGENIDIDADGNVVGLF